MKIELTFCLPKFNTLSLFCETLFYCSRKYGGKDIPTKKLKELMGKNDTMVEELKLVRKEQKIYIAGQGYKK